MRLSIENFGVGNYSAFIYGNNQTSVINNPLIIQENSVDNYNVAISGSSAIKTQLLNVWNISAFTLSATAVPGMKFDNTHTNISALMFNSFGVGLTNEISSTPYRVLTYNHTTSSYIEDSTQNDDHFIAVYKPVSSITDIEDYVPFAVAGPINFNYILEFSLQNSEYRPDYALGINFINAFHTKNMYNQVFNTETSISSDYSLNISGLVLDNCRTYKHIGSNNNDVFLVYSFGKKYSGSNIVSADTNYHTLRNVITEYPISSTTYTPPNTASQYEYVERIKGVGAWEGGLESKHKANIFSVKILNSQLNESITDTTTRAKIQNSINIVLRRLISEFIPAHTELFDIYWEGR